MPGSTKSQSKKNYLQHVLVSGKSNDSFTNEKLRKGNYKKVNEELRNHMAKIKTELDFEKSKTKQSHRDKVIELKKIRDEFELTNKLHLDEASIKMNFTKDNEIRKLKELLTKEKEQQIKQIIKFKDEEIKTLQKTFRAEKEFAVKEISEKSCQDSKLNTFNSDIERKLKSEILELRRAKESLEIISKDHSFCFVEKNNAIKELKKEHQREIQRILREARRENSRSLTELQQVKKSLDIKNIELTKVEKFAQKVAEEKEELHGTLRKDKTLLHQERNSLSLSSINDKSDKELDLISKNSELRRQLDASSSKIRKLEKEKTLFENDFDLKTSYGPVDKKIKDLKKRNCELVLIAKKLEEKARNTERKYNEMKTKHHDNEIHSISENKNNENLSKLKTSFAIQRAKDKAEHAQSALIKEKQLKTMDTQFQEIQTAYCHSEKERLRLEKQVAASPNISEYQTVQNELHEILQENKKVSLEVEELQNVHSNCLKEKTELNKKLKDLDSLIMELKVKEEECTALSTSLTNNEMKLTHLQKLLKEKEIQCTLLIKDSHINENNIKDLEGHIKDLKQQTSNAEKLKIVKLDLEMQLHEASENFEMMADKVADLKNEIKELKEALLDEQSNYNKLDNRYTEVHQKLIERDEDINSLHKIQEEVNNSTNVKINTLQDNLRHVEESYEKASVENKLLKEKISSYKSEQKLFSKETQISGPKNLHKKTQTSKSVNQNVSTQVTNPAEGSSQEVQVQPSCQSKQTQMNTVEMLHVGMQVNPVEMMHAGMQVNPVEMLHVGMQVNPVEMLHAGMQVNPVEMLHAGMQVNPDEMLYAGMQVNPVEVLHVGIQVNLLQEKTGMTSSFDSHDDILEVAAIRIEDLAITNSDTGSALYPYPESPLNSTDKNRLHRFKPPSVRVFEALHSYDPDLLSPNGDHEEELCFVKGDYLYTYGELDENGFYFGELKDGSRGLIPSNLVQRVTDDVGLNKDSTISEDENFTDEHMIPKPIICNDEYTASKNECLSKDKSKTKSNYNESLRIDDYSDPYDFITDPIEKAVPPPSNLRIDLQLNSSLVLRWDTPSNCDEDEIMGYTIYIDDDTSKRTAVGASRTKILISDIQIDEFHHFCVCTTLNNGRQSDRYKCMLTSGRGSSLAPLCLKVDHLKTVSASLVWKPSNSNLFHAIYLNDKRVDVIQPGFYTHAFENLYPKTKYIVIVEGRKFSSKPKSLLNSTTIEFETLPGLKPEAPIDFHYELTDDFIEFKWIPVTIKEIGTSNGSLVTGYKIYASNDTLVEISSPIQDHITIPWKDFKNYSHECLQEIFIRTQSSSGESDPSDSVAVNDIEILMEIKSNSSLVFNPENDAYLRNIKPDIDRIIISDGELSMIEEVSETESSARSAQEVSLNNPSNQEESIPVPVSQSQEVHSEPSCLQSHDKHRVMEHTFNTEQLESMIRTSLENNDDNDKCEQDESSSLAVKPCIKESLKYLGAATSTASLSISERYLSAPTDQNAVRNTGPLDNTLDEKSLASELLALNDTMEEFYSTESVTSIIDDGENSSPILKDENFAVHEHLTYQQTLPHPTYKQDLISDQHGCISDKQDCILDIVANKEKTGKPSDDQITSATFSISTLSDHSYPITDSVDNSIEDSIETYRYHPLEQKPYLHGNIKQGLRNEWQKQGSHNDNNNWSDKQHTLNEEKPQPSLNGVISNHTYSIHSDSTHSNTIHKDISKQSSIDENHNKTYSLKSNAHSTIESNEKFIKSNPLKPPHEMNRINQTNVDAEHQVNVLSMSTTNMDSTEIIDLIEKDAHRDILDEYPDLPLDTQNGIHVPGNEVDMSEDSSVDSDKDSLNSSHHDNVNKEESSFRISGRDSIEEDSIETNELSTLQLSSSVLTSSDHVTQSSSNQLLSLQFSDSDNTEIDELLNKQVVSPKITLRTSPKCEQSETVVLPQVENIEDPQTKSNANSEDLTNPFQPGFQSLTRSDDNIVQKTTVRRSLFQEVKTEKLFPAKLATTNDDLSDGTEDQITAPQNDDDVFIDDFVTSDQRPTSSTCSDSPINHDIINKSTNDLYTLGTATLTSSDDDDIDETDEKEECKQTTTTQEEFDFSVTPINGLNNSFTKQFPDGKHVDRNTTETNQRISPTMESGDSYLTEHNDRFDGVKIENTKQGMAIDSKAQQYLGVDPVADPGINERIRIFIAIYNYDPLAMSPNQEFSTDELAFTAGALIKIFGEMDEFGFYYGELDEMTGFVPGNMVQEIEVDDIDEAISIKEDKDLSTDGVAKQPDDAPNVNNYTGEDSFDTVLQKSSKNKTLSHSKSLTQLNEPQNPKHTIVDNELEKKTASMPNINDEWSSDPYLLLPQRMIALFDYDPIVNSPNVDCEVELAFTAGQVLHVYGGMDEDGFYAAKIEEKRGLVPSNFIRVSTETEHLREEIFDAVVVSPKLKKKNSILRKSKKLFSRLKGQK